MAGGCETAAPVAKPSAAAQAASRSRLQPCLFSHQMLLRPPPRLTPESPACLARKGWPQVSWKACDFLPWVAIQMVSNKHFNNSLPVSNILNNLTNNLSSFLVIEDAGWKKAEQGFGSTSARPRSELCPCLSSARWVQPVGEQWDPALTSGRGEHGPAGQRNRRSHTPSPVVVVYTLSCFPTHCPWCWDT